MYSMNTQRKREINISEKHRGRLSLIHIYCGSEIADGSKFCSQCGTPVDTVPKAAPVQASENSYQRPDTEKTASMASASYGVADAAKTGGSVSKDENTEETKRPSFEEFQWDVSEYPCLLYTSTYRRTGS